MPGSGDRIGRMKKNFTIPVLVVLLIVASFLVGSLWTRIKYQKQATKKEVAEVTPSPSVAGEKAAEKLPTTIGRFLITKEEVCKEEEKPLIYFFGSSSCPHCTWEKPIIAKVAAKFKNEIVYHQSFDSQTDKEVFERYASINPGYVPFLVFGCKYVRVGSGETAGEVEEEKNLTALICKLTDNQPEKVCAVLP